MSALLLIGRSATRSSMIVSPLCAVTPALNEPITSKSERTARHAAVKSVGFPGGVQTFSDLSHFTRQSE